MDKTQQQKLLNDLANLKNQVLKMPTLVYVALDKKQQTTHDLMTGLEWLKRFTDKLPDPYITALELDPSGYATSEQRCLSQGEKNMHYKALEAARIVAGIKK